MMALPTSDIYCGLFVRFISVLAQVVGFRHSKRILFRFLCLAFKYLAINHCICLQFNITCHCLHCLCLQCTPVAHIFEPVCLNTSDNRWWLLKIPLIASRRPQACPNQYFNCLLRSRSFAETKVSNCRLRPRCTCVTSNWVKGAV